MREAARALDDVSDHLGEVLRRADELLADWSRFGAQVRVQVEREPVVPVRDGLHVRGPLDRRRTGVRLLRLAFRLALTADERGE